MAVRIQDGSASVPTARAGASADVHAGLHLSLMAFPDFCRFVSPLLAALRVRECNVDSAPQLFQAGKRAVMSAARLPLRAHALWRTWPRTGFRFLGASLQG